MIVLITYKERNPKTGVLETLVSHGENIHTGRSVPLEVARIDSYQRAGAVFNTDMQEWVLGETAAA